MNLLRHRLVRLPIVVIGCAAWLAISNHCALAAVEGPANKPMPRCHGSTGHQSPAKHDEKKGDVECCKVLRATLLTFSKPATPLDQLQFTPVAHVTAVLPIPAQSLVRSPLELDTGPPCAGTFAELVLQRSVLAHAPPLFLS